MVDPGRAPKGRSGRGQVAVCALLVAAALGTGLLCAAALPGADAVAVVAGTGAMAVASLAALVGPRRPLTAAAAASGTAIAVSTVDPAWRELTAAGGLAWAPLAIAGAAVGLVSHERRKARLALGMAALAAYAVVTTVVTTPPEGSYLLSALGAASPVLGGTTLALTFRLTQARRERIRQEARERELIAERARVEERRRLAAEMHDTVTHQVSLMVLQAGALSVATDDPEVRSAADGIRGAGGRAIEELRSLIGVLRGDDAEPAGRSAEVPASGNAAAVGAGAGAGTGEANTTGGGGEPVPDPATLAEEARAAGQQVDYTASGGPEGLAPHTARTLYRVVQEALTNARKHAPGAAVEVRIDHRPDAVAVAVENGPPPPDAETGRLTAGAGTGLDGLRHRVELVGGSLEAGPTAGGGFAVRAELPRGASGGAGRGPEYRADQNERTGGADRTVREENA
ncbi:sensor histidine kinase [Nocardiopsis suaedae]|uniref:histidine kinase n=1 Tax=Nocardiopsis suaedae TaxID=3018444 RepID=A0ABT4TNI0_9ACTN|nr:sensor histidine kinase [Nocardiopsis suaedae]MDA2806250.1 histidine kinase [Nocardiopsis suaedae]